MGSSWPSKLANLNGRHPADRNGKQEGLRMRSPFLLSAAYAGLTTSHLCSNEMPKSQQAIQNLKISLQQCSPQIAICAYAIKKVV